MLLVRFTVRSFPDAMNSTPFVFCAARLVFEAVNAHDCIGWAFTAPSTKGYNARLAEQTFFYGMLEDVRYIWCANSCVTGCGYNNSQCEAVYRRKCVGPPSPAPRQIGGLVLVPQEPRQAACLDGSAPGYWMERGMGANATRWILHAQGGGWCWNEDECAKRALSDLGSSKNWRHTTTCYGSCDGILSRNCSINPDFCTWSHVFIGCGLLFAFVETYRYSSHNIPTSQCFSRAWY